MLYYAAGWITATLSMSSLCSAEEHRNGVAIYLQAEDEGRQHMGAWVEVSGQECAVEIMGERRTFTLSPEVKVVGPTGQPMKLTEVKPGRTVRLSCRKNEPQLVTHIAVLPD